MNKQQAKTIVIGAGALAAVGAWLYLAGAIVLMGLGSSAKQVSPFTFIQYAVYYGGHKQAASWLWIGALVASVVLFAPAALILRKRKPSLHGDASWATSAEIGKAGLFKEKGILVGEYSGKYLMFGGSQHVFVAAPTRSGKGVSLVIPNLLQWPDSCVVLDMKLENWDITSGYRSRYGQRCYLFNPVDTDGRTHRYNPLSYVSDDPGMRIDDLQKIANMLSPDMPGTDPIWTATPRALFLGICLYLFETPGKQRTIGQVLREILEHGDGAEYFSNVIEDRAKAGIPLSQGCVIALNAYCTIAAENTRSGVLSSLRSRLELWMNPLIDAATSGNDFDFRDLRKRKMSIYIGITPDNLERMGPLLNLFFQQLIDANIRELPAKNQALKYQCLLLLDEFTAIGKIAVLSKGVGFIAGYGLRMMPILQNASQAVEVYGKDAAQTLQTNHAMTVIFAPKASELQATRDISEWLGYQTVKSASKSRSTMLFRNPNRSENVSDQRRALLLPQEISELGQDAEIVVTENVRPIKARKARYFADAKFMDRLKEISPTLRAVGRRLPTKEELDKAMFAGELAATVPTIDLAQFQREIYVGAPGAPKETLREFVEADLPRISKMTFKIDFNDIPAPAPEERTDEQILAWVDRLSTEVGFDIS